MNMKHYQEFVKIVGILDSDKMWTHQEKAIESDMPRLKKKYKQLQGITDEFIIKSLELRNNKTQEREIRTYLDSCHVFEIDDRHKYLLSETKIPNEKEAKLWNMVRLPFPEIFLDVEFTPDDDDRLSEAITGILVKEMKDISTTLDKKGKHIFKTYIYGLQCYFSGRTKEGHIFIDKFLFPLVTMDEDNSVVGTKTYYDDKKKAKFLKDFLINFTLFLKEREVEWVTINRSAKNKERRIRNRQLPLPSSNVIRLTGKLKKYMDSLDFTTVHGKYGYKFNVRGHWRHLVSEQFKHKKGQVIWISPFTKGEGVLVKKSYSVLPKDESDTINYEDIRPLNKSLRRMRK